MPINVTLRGFHVITVAVENKYYIFQVCAYSLNYAAYNAHMTYYTVMWPVRHYQIFPHYLINGKIFEKKFLNINYVFRFSLQHLSETFLILRVFSDILS